MKHIILLFGLFIAYQALATSCEQDSSMPSIRYLGVGALDIHYQNQRLITDPFFSPQSYWDIISLTPYTSDKNAIKAALGPAKRDINTILIGHGHYDHAADTPALTEYLAQDIKILSSQSTQFLLQDKIKSVHLMGLDKEDFNQWHTVANGWIRIKATPSEHAPQALGINLFPEIHQHPLEEPPKYIWQWTQGTNITWLVDFLSKPFSQAVTQRIYIQTSAANFPVGAPDISDNVTIDKMFLAAASFDHVANYPSGLIKRYQPKEVILVHWENFFQPWFENPIPLSLIDFDKLISNKTLAGQKQITSLGQPNTCY